MTAAVSRCVAALCTVLLAAAAVLSFRTMQRGEGELGLSDRAFDAGRVELALEHAQRAATAYVPGARHVDAAYARLRAIARGAELARNPELARVAWNAMRAAAWQSRHVWQPRAAELLEADSELARLDGTVAPPAATRPGVPFVIALAGGALLGVLGLWWLLGQEPSARPGGPGRRLAAVSCLVGALAWSWALFQL